MPVRIDSLVNASVLHVSGALLSQTKSEWKRSVLKSDTNTVFSPETLLERLPTKRGWILETSVASRFETITVLWICPKGCLVKFFAD
jgi:hypothetical protein